LREGEPAAFLVTAKHALVGIRRPVTSGVTPDLRRAFWHFHGDVKAIGIATRGILRVPDNRPRSASNETHDRYENQTSVHGAPLSGVLDGAFTLIGYPVAGRIDGLSPPSRSALRRDRLRPAAALA